MYVFVWHWETKLLDNLDITGAGEKMKQKLDAANMDGLILRNRSYVKCDI